MGDAQLQDRLLARLEAAEESGLIPDTGELAEEFAISEERIKNELLILKGSALVSDELSTFGSPTYRLTTRGRATVADR